MQHQIAVKIIQFPTTPVALITHLGDPNKEHQTVKQLIAWRIENKLSPEMHQSYGIHYTDPSTTTPEQHQVDFCVSYDKPVLDNPYGIISGKIPAGRCALTRYLGSRQHISSAAYLYQQWLPNSGESLRDFPIFFHYVNLGPNIKPQHMITDVYLPIA